MPTTVKLSRREREILEIVFSLGEATLTEILDCMDEPPTRAALRSVLTIMEQKGHLRHTRAGREFVYRPTMEKRGAGRSALKRVLEVFFGGKLEDALSAHFTDPSEKLSGAEIEALEAIIAGAARKKSRVAR
jgi:predicted transcriptional regulator